MACACVLEGSRRSIRVHGLGDEACLCAHASVVEELMQFYEYSHSQPSELVPGRGGKWEPPVKKGVAAATLTSSAAPCCPRWRLVLEVLEVRPS